MIGCLEGDIVYRMNRIIGSLIELIKRKKTLSAIVIFSIAFILLYVMPFLTTKSPKIVSIEPNSLLVNNQFSEDGTITIRGEDLENTYKAYVNGESIDKINVISSTEVKVELPRAEYGKVGKIEIQLKKKEGSIVSKKSNQICIDVLDKDTLDTPEIEDISWEMKNGVITEDSNGTRSIFIEGSNFSKEVEVLVDNKKMKSVILQDENTLKVRIPYEEWVLKDELEVVVAQTYNGYITDLKSKKVELETYIVKGTPVEHEYEWVKDSYLVAHAFGGVNGKSYTNSLEAFRNNYELGHKVFEIDFCLTADNVLIARRDWSALLYKDIDQVVPSVMENNLPQTYEEIKKYEGRYSVVTFEEICRIMLEYPDMYIVTDTKESNKQAVEYIFNNMKEIASNIDISLLDRIVVQIYNRAMYKALMDVYPFKSIIYTLYDSPDTNQEVVDFVKETNVRAITMPSDRSTEEFVGELNELGCYVYTHTINKVRDAKSQMEKGVYGFYTDFLTFEDLKMVPKTYHKQVVNNRKLQEADIDIISYLNSIKGEDYITIFSVMDEGSAAITDEIQEVLNDLGLEKELMNQYRSSYLAILDDGCVITEELSDEQLSISVEVGENKIDVISAGLEAGCYSSIKINGIEYSTNQTGLNIVVYDKIQNRVIDSVNIDTYLTLDITRRKDDDQLIDDSQFINKYLDDLSKGCYTLYISIKDDGTALLTDEIMERLKQLGVTVDLRGKFRNSYIGIIDEKQSIYEEISKQKLHLNTELNGLMVQIESSNIESGNYSSIQLDGIEYSKNQSGINIVVYDKRLGKVIDSVCLQMNGELKCIRD